MIFKNTANQGVYLYVSAYNGAAVTGLAATITATISKDGAAPAATATANPTEIGGGVYWLPLSQGETNCNAFAVLPATTSLGVYVDPIIAYTQGGAVPAVTAGTSGGLPVIGSAPLTNLDAAVTSRSTYAGGDTAGTTTLLTRVPAAAALASQIPANFTTATFASAGVFATAALANAPSGSGGSGASALAIRLEIDANSTQLAALVSAAAATNGALAALPNLFTPAVVSTPTSATSFVVVFAGTAPPASGLVGTWCCLTTAGRAPQKLPILNATPVDSTHVALTFAGTGFAAAPLLNDAVAIG